MPKTPSTRLAALLLGYLSLMIILLTLSPFYFAAPTRLRLSWHLLADDVVINLALFLPIGYLARLTRSRWGAALLLGAGLSAGIEMTQVFLPMRTPSAIDLVSNTLGTALGAGLHDRLAARLAMTPGLVGRLALEIPLMGFLYLMVPLLWVNTLTLGTAPDRWALTALLGLGGAIVLSEVLRQWWGPPTARTLGRFGLAAGGWFLAGAGPGLLRPGPAWAVGVGVAALTALLAALPRAGADRRFERATLQRLLPPFLLYLALSSLWPLTQPWVPWHGGLGLTERPVDESVSALLPLIEYLAAFTLLGYLSAEWRGRAETPLRRDLPLLTLIPLAAALALEAGAGFQAGPGASLVRLGVVTGGALLGGVLYHLQRAQVRALLGRPPEAGPARSAPEGASS